MPRASAAGVARCSVGIVQKTGCSIAMGKSVTRIDASWRAPSNAPRTSSFASPGTAHARLTQTLQVLTICITSVLDATSSPGPTCPETKLLELDALETVKGAVGDDLVHGIVTPPPVSALQIKFDICGATTATVCLPPAAPMPFEILHAGQPPSASRNPAAWA